ncbi:ATP-dependent DNA/RNA helicase dhx36 [Nowakowskiella sp. JEL0407]|nr:ATP-dependent DNA/RNA helicase dhx36 [Nowakowskiella sp. JEL0407]
MTSLDHLLIGCELSIEQEVLLTVPHVKSLLLNYVENNALLTEIAALESRVETLVRHEQILRNTAEGYPATSLPQPHSLHSSIAKFCLSFNAKLDEFIVDLNSTITKFSNRPHTTSITSETILADLYTQSLTTLTSTTTQQELLSDTSTVFNLFSPDESVAISCEVSRFVETFQSLYLNRLSLEIQEKLLIDSLSAVQWVPSQLEGLKRLREDELVEFRRGLVVGESGLTDILDLDVDGFLESEFCDVVADLLGEKRVGGLVGVVDDVGNTYKSVKELLMSLAESEVKSILFGRLYEVKVLTREQFYARLITLKEKIMNQNIRIKFLHALATNETDRIEEMLEIFADVSDKILEIHEQFVSEQKFASSLPQSHNFETVDSSNPLIHQILTSLRMTTVTNQDSKILADALKSSITEIQNKFYTQEKVESDMVTKGMKTLNEMIQSELSLFEKVFEYSSKTDFSLAPKSIINHQQQTISDTDKLKMKVGEISSTMVKVSWANILIFAFAEPPQKENESNEFQMLNADAVMLDARAENERLFAALKVHPLSEDSLQTKRLFSRKTCSADEKQCRSSCTSQTNVCCKNEICKPGRACDSNLSSCRCNPLNETNCGTGLFAGCMPIGAQCCGDFFYCPLGSSCSGALQCRKDDKYSVTRKCTDSQQNCGEWCIDSSFECCDQAGHYCKLGTVCNLNTKKCVPDSGCKAGSVPCNVCLMALHAVLIQVIHVPLEIRAQRMDLEAVTVKIKLPVEIFVCQVVHESLNSYCQSGSICPAVAGGKCIGNTASATATLTSGVGAQTDLQVGIPTTTGTDLETPTPGVGNSTDYLLAADIYGRGGMDPGVIAIIALAGGSVVILIGGFIMSRMLSQKRLLYSLKYRPFNKLLSINPSAFPFSTSIPCPQKTSTVTKNASNDWLKDYLPKSSSKNVETVSKKPTLDEAGLLKDYNKKTSDTDYVKQLSSHSRRRRSSNPNTPKTPREGAQQEIFLTANLDLDNDHQTKRTHRNDHHHHHTHEEVLTTPTNSLSLPHIEDAPRRFIRYYFQAVSKTLPNIEPTSTLPSARGKRRDPMWVARMVLPTHRGIDGTMIDQINVLGVAIKRKDAEARCMRNFIQHLLNFVNEEFMIEFTESCKTVKQKLQEISERPIFVELPEENLDTINDLLDQAERQNAFEFPDYDAVANRSSPMGFGGTLNKFTPPESISSLVLPHQIRVPNDLKGLNLPVVTRYAEIMAAIESNQVTVLSAETGAGKTTQVPQFILAHFEEVQKHMNVRPPNVIVTQPRRIAAISVAMRVADERGEVIGKPNCSVGYQVRFEKKSPTVKGNVGKMNFCTSGILLKKLQDDPKINDITHIVLDEVHERDLNTDLLLVIIRELLQVRPDLKLILMSATADTKLFQNYFLRFGHRRNLPPVVHVPGKLFPVTEHYIEDIVPMLRDSGLSYQLRNPDVAKYCENEIGMYASRDSEEQPLELFEAIIANICKTQPDGAILCFLPGWPEINSLHQLLLSDSLRVGFGNTSKFKIFVLHSSVPTSAQKEVFDRTPPGVRKIILSTNIAETSVTINDIVYVVDSGKMRVNGYDAERRISSLSSVWASKSNLRQRIGRAGRCQSGYYYSLMNKRRKENLPHQIEPELLRVDLQSTCLQVKALQLPGDVKSILSKAPQPPTLISINTALEGLRRLGAIDRNEKLTFLGQTIAGIPLDPWISKLVLEAATLKCLDPIVTLAASMGDGKGVFSIHPDMKTVGRDFIISNYSQNTFSDQIMSLVAFQKWKNGEIENLSESFLGRSSLINLEKSRKQIEKILEDGNVIAHNRYNDLIGGAELNKNSSDMTFIRAVLCGALYPNVAEVRQKDEFRSSNGERLKLTGSSVNSMRGIKLNFAIANATNSTSEVENDDSETNDFEEVNPNMVATVPRLLCFQEKQKVDNLLYMRQTTKADPAALFVLSDFSIMSWHRVEQSDAVDVILDRSITFRFRNERLGATLRDLRTYIDKYVQWMTWMRTHSAGEKLSFKEPKYDDWVRLGDSLVAELVKILKHNDK